MVQTPSRWISAIYLLLGALAVGCSTADGLIDLGDTDPIDASVSQAADVMADDVGGALNDVSPPQHRQP